MEPVVDVRLSPYANDMFTEMEAWIYARDTVG